MSAEGSELLIVDPVAADRDAMRAHFEGRGYVCTALASEGEARELLLRKFFPVALIDLDVGEAGGGLSLLRFVRERSPATATLLLTGRRSFDGALRAHREGVFDLILKAPDQVPYLEERVALACEQVAFGSAAALRELRDLLDESFRVMVGLSRRAYEGSGGLRVQVLVVDHDAAFLEAVAEGLAGRCELVTEPSGGAALDVGTSQRVDLVAVRDDLLDLSGRLVLRSLRDQHPELVGLVYRAPGEGRGVRVTHSDELEEPPLADAQDLSGRLAAVAAELGEEAADRRALTAFRNDHQDFVRRVADVKLRLDRLLERTPDRPPP